MKLVARIFDSYPRIQDSIRGIRFLFTDENPELCGRIPRMGSCAHAKPLGRGPDDHKIGRAETRDQNNGLGVSPRTRNRKRGVINHTWNVQMTHKSNTWCQRHHMERPKDANVMSHDVIVSIITIR